MLESRTGESKNDVGLNPGGIVMHGDLEMGSFAGDISLYLAIDPVRFRSLGDRSSELEWDSPELVASMVTGGVDRNQSRSGERGKGMEVIFRYPFWFLSETLAERVGVS